MNDAPFSGVEYGMRALPAGKDQEGIGLVCRFLVILIEHLLRDGQFAKADTTGRAGPAGHVYAFLPQPFSHLLSFRFPSGMALGGAVAAADDEYPLFRLEMTDYLFYGFLDGSVHR